MGWLALADLLVLLAVGGVPLPRGHNGCCGGDDSGNPLEVLLLQGLALAEVGRHNVQLSARSPWQAGLQSSPDDRVQMYLVYRQYWTLNLRPLMLYPTSVLPLNSIIKAVQHSNNA